MNLSLFWHAGLWMNIEAKYINPIYLQEKTDVRFYLSGHAGRPGPGGL